MKKNFHILHFTFYISLVLFTGCSKIPFIGKKTTGKITTIKENLNSDRLTDLSVVKRLAGHKKFLFVSRPRYTDWIDGYLKGVIVDEDGKPLANIQILVDGIGFENAVTDVNGVYKVRFSIPIVSGLADVNGKLLIHPKWETELEINGVSYKPTIKDAPFRIYYNGNVGGIIALTEGNLPPKITVKKITLSQYKRKEIFKKKKAIKKKPTKKTTPTTTPGFGDDLFKALEDFNK